MLHATAHRTTTLLSARASAPAAHRHTATPRCTWAACCRLRAVAHLAAHAAVLGNLARELALPTSPSRTCGPFRPGRGPRPRCARPTPIAPLGQRHHTSHARQAGPPARVAISRMPRSAMPGAARRAILLGQDPAAATGRTPHQQLPSSGTLIPPFVRGWTYGPQQRRWPPSVRLDD
jgi:hypothetical protein